MNPDAPDFDEDQWSEDQQAIEEYFHSDLYRWQCSDDANRPVKTWFLEQLISPTRIALASYCYGLLGLSFLLMVFAVLFPVVLEALEDYFTGSTFAATVVVFQLFFFPPVICFSFATVTPMFWYGSVTLRFLTATVLVIPGCLGFYIALSFIEGVPNREFWIGFVKVMFADFLAAGAVALTIQMWTPWTLMHARESESPLPPLGTRAMMELTGIAAVGCAIVFSFDVRDYLEGIMLFVGIGFFSSLAIIGVMISFLSVRRRSSLAIGIAVFFSFATAFLFSAVFAAQGFGYQAIALNLLIVSAVAFCGTLAIIATMALCLWWLRHCGWTCVKRGSVGNRTVPDGFDHAAKVRRSSV